MYGSSCLLPYVRRHLWRDRSLERISSFWCRHVKLQLREEIVGKRDLIVRFVPPPPHLKGHYKGFVQLWKDQNRLFRCWGHSAKGFDAHEGREPFVSARWKVVPRPFHYCRGSAPRGGKLKVAMSLAVTLGREAIASGTLSAPVVLVSSSSLLHAGV